MFVIEDESSGRLHIEYRPKITADIAIDTFWDGMHAWNVERLRYECYSPTHGIYWTWLYGDPNSTNVLILSCFPLEEDEID